MPEIIKIHAREILDSRGKPTVEAEVSNNIRCYGKSGRTVRCIYRRA